MPDKLHMLEQDYKLDFSMFHTPDNHFHVNEETLRLFEEKNPHISIDVYRIPEK